MKFKRIIVRLSVVLLQFTITCYVTAQPGLKLWYKQPAIHWVEALPVGNGHIGGMIFGGVEEELIQLNESTLYSGGPVKRNINQSASAFLPQIREALLKNEDYSKADTLAKKMQGLYTESYMPLGDLVIKQNFKGVAPSAYSRSLDISQAISTTMFTVNGVRYVREIFTSFPGNIMIIRLTSSVKGALTFDVSAKSQLHYTLSINNNKELVVSGKAPAHVDPSYYNLEGREPIIYEDTSGCNGMRYEFRAKATAKDGKITTDTSGIHVHKASEVILYVSAATSFNGFDKCPFSEGKDEKLINSTTIANALKKSYSTLRAEHLKDYKKYFNRVSFALRDTLPNNPNKFLPSDERLKAYSKNAYDPALETLYFQFGRYLLISSSRPGGPPANLQGLWNKELRAPWSSNYTININTQMNYWPAEVTNLSEMHLPLLSWIKDLSITGANTAKEFYKAKGWVAHHNSEIWGTSNPVGDKGSGDPVWANWYMGGNWLCRHLWEHYAYTGDKKFLAEKAYPIMKEATLFTLDWLVENKDGHLVTAPSTTPENKFKDSNGIEQGVSVATTMDMSIIWDLFTNVIEASEVLGIDTDFKNTLIEKRNKLYPMRIGSKGQLLEWYKEFEETDPRHRHVSHLFGLHPGRQLSLSQTPDLFNAAKKTLEIRGDEGTGWSKGWKINWWARLLNGDHAYKLIRQLLLYTNTNAGSRQGGTYPNFFDAHPPFQIDGNFAGTAGMAEMLLQSHAGFIQLLPALPEAWKEGSVEGLKARGAFLINMQWKDQKFLKASITSLNGGRCVIKTGVALMLEGGKDRPVREGNNYTLSFETVKGQVYKLTTM